MEHLTEEQNERLTQAISDINGAVNSAKIPEGYNIEIPEADDDEKLEIENIKKAHKVKVAFNSWINSESRPDWLVGELVKVF